MNEIVKPAGILLIITAVAALLLGLVSEITKGPIEAQNQKTEQVAMQAVMPDADSFEKIEMEKDGNVSKVSKALTGGKEVGYVITVEPSGFGGAVSTMIGVDNENTITGLRVLNHSETPGLGALATAPAFYEQFAGMSGNIAVTKDGGTVQAITSATITSRAISDGANEALKWIAENADGGAK